MERTVNWELQGNIAIIRFCNPPTNDVSLYFLSDFLHCLNEIDEEKNIKVLVVMSSLEIVFSTSTVGRTAEDKDEVRTSNKLLSDVIEKLTSQTYPTIAIVSGYATGAGFELALACDYRIATKSARFGFTNRTKPTNFTKAALINLIGTAKSQEVSQIGQIIAGNDAKKIGLVDRTIRGSIIMSDGLEIENLIFSQLGKALKSGKRFFHNTLLEEPESMAKLYD
ncbi:enoyl-CoA hydratase/isomerase family protein [Neobacillus sp. NRS-1170]|uniref:enoyl-CoA hydratase/isomerase family protein n=1 Tax=Neobacillus sp. NRS-1170 TaxID=3233898 RepID=UPI003D2E7F09